MTVRVVESLTFYALYNMTLLVIDNYDVIISTFVYTCNERKLLLLRYTLINEAVFVQILFSQ